MKEPDTIQQIEQNLQFYKDKRVLITGGTKGLGRSLVEHLIHAGAIVTVVARTEADLREVGTISDRVFTIPADMSRKKDIHRISGQAIGMMEGIDILINNASTLGKTPLQPLLDTDCEDLEKVLYTNLIGPFRLTKAILPAMKFLKEGLVINITSDASVHPYPTWGSYSVSKAALDHLTAIWKEEMTDSKVNFVSIDPGDMYTEMHLRAIPDAVPDKLFLPDNVARDLLKFLMVSDLSKSRYTADEWRNEL